MEKSLRNRVVFISGETSMRDVIGTMRDHNISSVLVTDHSDKVAGIITERDIVQKFTLLEVADKLDSKAFAVMNRPLKMARISHLYQDIHHLFKTHGYRHFPVTTASDDRKDVIGMMTVTDIAHAWLTSSQKKEEESRDQPPFLAIVAGDDPMTTSYQMLFSSLGFHPFIEGDPRTRLEFAVARKIPILLDIDGLTLSIAKEYLVCVKHHRSLLLLLSSEPQLVQPLKQHLQGPLINISLKPLDISQILRVLQQVRQGEGVSEA
jgi:CBS domain-containing protein